jgi:hypothetical protein
MIYEIRTYTLRPATTGEVEKLLGEAYPEREKFSKLAGFFHTEIGPLNEVIHIWPYEDVNERDRIRGEARASGKWPPAIGDYIVNQKVEILHPWPFAPQWEPGADGPVYEMRQYTFRTGAQPRIMKEWEEMLPKRLEISPIALLGHTEFGPSANSFIHIWPYASIEDRNQKRREAIQAGVWPPPSGRELFLTQSSKILLPAAFSPAQ